MNTKKLKNIIKSITPKIIIKIIIDIKMQKYKNKTTQEIFCMIYEKKEWGKESNKPASYYSGSGSHDPSIVNPYLNSVKNFLLGLKEKPNIVDLGCGDFFVGSQIRPLCSEYIACDIVPNLIEFNKNKYASCNVSFSVLNMVTDNLPKGDIVFVRQVFQHLSNADVLQVIPKLSDNYKYMILTEHLPIESNFTANIDKPTGPSTRLEIGSGIVLTASPFNLTAIKERILCEVPADSGKIRTVLYQLKA